MALEGKKNKLGFIDGTIPKPKPNSPNFLNLASSSRPRIVFFAYVQAVNMVMDKAIKSFFVNIVD
ncbi:hypothetical protein CR513_20956, partial [Mucuna pruriens]